MKRGACQRTSKILGCRGASRGSGSGTPLMHMHPHIYPLLLAIIT